MGKGVSSQVSKTTPSHRSSSLPSPHPLGYCRRGCCDPTEPLSTTYRPDPARNRAMGVQFRVFGPQTPPLPRFVRRRTTPPPPPLPHPPTTSPHRSPPPFPTARPKSSRRARFCGFCAKPPPLPLYFQSDGHTTTNTTTTSPHCPFPPSPAAVLHGAHETEPRRFGFGFWPKPLPLPCALRTHNTTITTT